MSSTGTTTKLGKEETKVGYVPHDPHLLAELLEGLEHVSGFERLVVGELEFLNGHHLVAPLALVQLSETARPDLLI
jgi:hypothetical protein